jgi:transketolase
MEMKYIPKTEFDKVRALNIAWDEKCQILSKMSRLNTLFEVKRAGSGHLGSSLSAMDIVVYLYEKHMNVMQVGINSPERDIYYSSKGHDAPGLYAVLYSLGIVPENKFLALRRLDGLDGHPDVKIPGVEANTGSLGMGISKGRGIAFAKAYNGNKGKVIVMVGDGEFQEGQNFEALQSTAHQKNSNVLVVMDHNKLQSDRYIDRIVSLGNLEKKIEAFGWAVMRCDGHNYKELERCFNALDAVKDRPKFLICDTIKGSGISFMEHPQALKDNNGFFKWHAGAPDNEVYTKAYTELFAGVEADFKKVGLNSVARIEPAPEARPATKVSSEVLAEAYGKTLVKMASERNDFVVLDADLSLDCKLREFEDKFPARFIEMGIAEQDMVSMACGIAGKGLLPICNSFANFMAARANEQIYNTQSEGRKIIYANHYAGLIPAGPGKSHQAIRDISLLCAFPNVTIIQPANSQETEALTRWAINEAKESVGFRMNIGPSPRMIEFSKDWSLKMGQGNLVSAETTKTAPQAIISYGPVMLHEALLASESLAQKGVHLAVYNIPWLNKFDESWFKDTLKNVKHLFVLDDHSVHGGLGDLLTSFLNEKNLLKTTQVRKFGVEGFPACGTPWEALKFHGLDGATLASRVVELIK